MKIFGVLFAFASAIDEMMLMMMMSQQSQVALGQTSQMNSKCSTFFLIQSTCTKAGFSSNSSFSSMTNSFVLRRKSKGSE